MNSQEFYGLMEAYQEVYEAREEEGESNFVKKDIRGRRFVGNTQGEAGVVNYDNTPVETRGTWVGAARRRAHKAQRNEQVDIYDLVLDHLLDEGFCDDVNSANVIMAHMSEEWLDEILDEANKAERMLGLSSRERERARNLNQYIGKPSFYNNTKGGRGDNSDPILNKAHKHMTQKRQKNHNALRYQRADLGAPSTVVKSRYQANKDHQDGYPSITKRGEGPA
jgi:hypothetical protein